jgi:putative transposase
VSDEATPGEETLPADKQLARELVERARTEGVELVGPGGLLTDLTKSVLETALEVEIEDHLGYPKHASEGRNTGNSRNGSRSKTVLTEVGEVEIAVPRDREGSFEPQIVKKRQRRLAGVDELVISLAAKGLTTGEIAAHFADVYGAEVSRDTISRITDRVLEEMTAWQNRPLDSVYPVVFIDAIVVKIRDGQVANRPVYSVVGVTVDGTRDVLGLWIGDGSEGAKYWHQVLSEIRNRGAADVFIVVCDGLRVSSSRSVTSGRSQSCRPACCTSSATASATRARPTGTSSPATCARSTPRRPSRPHGNASTSSPASGATATRRSSGSGRTPGRSSYPSSPTAPRSGG